MSDRLEEWHQALAARHDVIVETFEWHVRDATVGRYGNGRSNPSFFIRLNMSVPSGCLADDLHKRGSTAGDRTTLALAVYDYDDAALAKTTGVGSAILGYTSDSYTIRGNTPAEFLRRILPFESLDNNT